MLFLLVLDTDLGFMPGSAFFGPIVVLLGEGPAETILKTLGSAIFPYSFRVRYLVPHWHKMAVILRVFPFRSITVRVEELLFLVPQSGH